MRPGLTFHDGSPVTTRDVIATLRRMFIRDTQNQIFANLIVAMERVDDRTFTLRLKEPFNYVEFLLGGSNGVAGAIMREQEALTDPFTPIKDADRLRAVSFQHRRIQARRAAGLRQIRRLRAAQASRRVASPAARWSKSIASSWW